MTDSFNVWQFVGGIGLFLFAMTQLEAALQAFAGRPLRLFLKRHAGNSLKSIAIGAASTAIVQSSSLVGLMVLAFVGASIMSLTNALGIVFGANLGTTLTGWFVATIGFRLDLGDAALPLIGVGTLAFVGLRGQISEVGRLLAAIGFLLMGISLMKDGVATLGADFDITRLSAMHAWQYLLFGVVFAAVVQSSSAAMVVTLTALHSGVIDLQSGAAIAVGADLGTTTTVLVGALQGASAKKRVALAHLIFNITTAVVAFSLIGPLLWVVQRVGIVDPLFSLVAFHSLFNFLGILIFLPIMRPFARFLEKRFVSPSMQESVFVSETDPNVTDAAIAAAAAEAEHLVSRVIRHNMTGFVPPLMAPDGQSPVRMPVTTPDEDEENGDGQYRRIKLLEGEILSFALKVQTQSMEPEFTTRLNQLLQAVRHAVHSAKALRDVRHNLDEFADSPKQTLNDYYQDYANSVNEFLGKIYRLPSVQDAKHIAQDFGDLQELAIRRHDEMGERIYGDIHNAKLADSETSSLLNVNREVLNSKSSLALALQELCLEEGRESDSMRAGRPDSSFG